MLGLGFAGLAARDEDDAADRKEDARLSPVLPVRVCPRAGRTVTEAR